MAPNPRLIDRVLATYREGDLHECIHLVRTLVEAAPQATAPRQLLAALFAITGNGRQALAQYRRLLPLAVERGEVIRSIAFQKQIDVYDRPESLVPGRWSELQKQLRMRGLPFAGEAPGRERPWVETQLLALPRAWFERIAAETRFEIMGTESRTLDVESGTVWEVLAGRVRWSFALPDGRASSETLAAEGDAVHVDPGLARTARVSFLPELPVEALRFDATLARDLRLALAAGLQGTPSMSEGLTAETRALLPTRPRRIEDLDERPVVPEAIDGAEPPRLPREEPAEIPADTGAWVDFGVLSLSDAAAARRDSEGQAPGEPPSSEPAEPPATEAATPPVAGSGIEIPALADLLGLSRSGAPSEPEAASAPSPEEQAQEDLPSEPIPISGEDEPVVERRRHPRVAVSLESRVALLRLSGNRVTPIRGQLADLSTSGFSIRFENQQLGDSREALTDALVAVDLDVSGLQGSLRVAAQVRWLDVDEPGDVARLGIEFVLLTEPDRKRIAGTLARAALAAREAALRKAA
ncbi:MAG TPA: PilZ domain-containing protein [Candidatus Eisenbacteria bacterium]|nr:PilZ domain-containing protein [Candidatus Eisenbacteria bacterium]